MPCIPYNFLIFVASELLDAKTKESRSYIYVYIYIYIYTYKKIFLFGLDFYVIQKYPHR